MTSARSSAPFPGSPRREGRKPTQEEKSAATRERLLDATLDCLHDLGYARTTTIEVAERAGLSRGAMLHHYPSKAALVAAAIEHLAERRIAEFVEAVGRLAEVGDSIPDVIDLLHAQFTSPSYFVGLELSVAARTDEELRASILPVFARYETIIAERARELFAHLAPSLELFEMQRRFVYTLLHGIAVMRLSGADPGEEEKLLADLKRPFVGLRVERRNEEKAERPDRPKRGEPA
ncbi:MAG: TetR/AcrR family transcriptional regulator [Polyangiales bacterium]